MTRLLLAAALLVTLVGCGTPTAVAPTERPLVGPALTQGVISAPAAVSIPAIGADSSLVQLGLNVDGTLAVPPVTEPGQASVFLTDDAGVVPGQPGPAVISGHRSGRLDGVSVPGVFARLPDLVPGDVVLTTDTSGAVLRWVVERVETYPKDAVDWVEIAGDTDGPELRLITCDGVLTDNGTGGLTYDSNTAVFAVPA